jgi:hypothetical protein
VAIAAGGYHSLALKQDGSIVGWGWNHRGQVTPPPGNHYVAITAGGDYSLAIVGCQHYAPPCDLNDDCTVNYLDLEILAGDWLADNADLATDINEDSAVDLKDYTILADMWLE